MARPNLRRAVARLGQLAVGANAGLSVHAPEQAVVRRRHVGIVFRLDELTLPAQRRAEVFAVGIEAIGVGHQHHAAPPERPAAFSGPPTSADFVLAGAQLRMARFTATLVRVILYLLWLSGRALATAALAAAIAASGVMVLPSSA